MAGNTRLYGLPLSSATRRAALILIEKGVRFDFVNVDLAKGEHKSAEYLQKHPFGQIPYLVRITYLQTYRVFPVRKLLIICALNAGGW